ncbi:MAG: hypothetical protein NTX02_04975 [Planctomycetia bacterium]|nr:hypothetical protein [Planctomycetia bacterium]
MQRVTSDDAQTIIADKEPQGSKDVTLENIGKPRKASALLKNPLKIVFFGISLLFS